MSFGDETAKLVDFVRIQPSPLTNRRPNYFVFMINRERLKSNGLMKLFSVKIKWASQDAKENESSSDSDFGGTSKKLTDEMAEERDVIREESKAAEQLKKKNASSDLKLKFEYVTEVMPKVSNF